MSAHKSVSANLGELEHLARAAAPLVRQHARILEHARQERLIPRKRREDDCALAV